MIDLSFVKRYDPPQAPNQQSSTKPAADGLQFVDSSSSSSSSHFSTATTAAPSLHNDPSGDTTSVDLPESSSFTPAFLKTARHPLSCIFHLLFKALALTTFMLGSVIFGGWNGDYVFSFVTTTILLSMDFWTVKNVTGRLLVGMRWWNNVKEDGSSEWVYEAHTDERVINMTDKTVFWTALYLWPLIWIIFLIIYLLRFQIEWVLLVLIGIALSGANLIGYWKCSKETKTRIEQWATNTTFRTLLRRFV